MIIHTHKQHFILSYLYHLFTKSNLLLDKNILKGFLIFGENAKVNFKWINS